MNSAIKLDFTKKPHGFENVDQPVDVLIALSDLAKTADHFVLLAGPSGVGKTFAAKACLKACHENFRQAPLDATYVINIPQLNTLWSRDRDLFEHKMHYAQRAQLLLIDDIGFREPTAAFLDVLYDLVNERVETQKGALVTTNLTSAQMESVLGSAVKSRLCSGKIFRVDGKDRRLEVNGYKDLTER